MRTMYHTRLYSHSVCVCNNEWCTACFCMHTRVCDNKSRAAGSCARACALHAQEKTCTRKIRLKWNNENLETARCITAIRNTLCLTGLRNSLNVLILISGHLFSWDAPILLFNFYCVFLCRFLHIAHVLVFLCRMRVFVHVCVPSHCLFVCMCFCVLKWCINVDVLMKPMMLRGDLLMACLRVRACEWISTFFTLMIAFWWHGVVWRQQKMRLCVYVCLRVFCSSESAASENIYHRRMKFHLWRINMMMETLSQWLHSSRRELLTVCVIVGYSSVCVLCVFVSQTLTGGD